jgi:hypothetical protein
MRDFACASVKLFEPAAGAPGLFALGLAIAGVVALGFAEGAAVCANAPPATAAPTRTVMTAVVAKNRFIDSFPFSFIKHAIGTGQVGHDRETCGRFAAVKIVYRVEPWPADFFELTCAGLEPRTMGLFGRLRHPISRSCLHGYPLEDMHFIQPLRKVDHTEMVSIPKFTRKFVNLENVSANFLNISFGIFGSPIAGPSIITFCCLAFGLLDDLRKQATGP